MMIPWRFTTVIGLGAALLVGVGNEVASAIGAFSTAPAAAIAPSDLQFNALPTSAIRPSLTATIGTILTRPLFNWNRQASPTTGTTDGPVPRLSGIIVGAAGRYAIFAAPSGGKPQIIQEGGTIGRFTIDAITTDHVILKNATGAQNLHTSFGPTPPPPMPTPDAS